jgi:hypothetical protein
MELLRAFNGRLYPALKRSVAQRRRTFFIWNKGEFHVDRRSARIRATNCSKQESDRSSDGSAVDPRGDLPVLRRACSRVSGVRCRCRDLGRGIDNANRNGWEAA